MFQCPEPGCEHIATHDLIITAPSVYVTHGPACYEHTMARLAQADQRHGEQATIKARPTSWNIECDTP